MSSIEFAKVEYHRFALSERHRRFNYWYLEMNLCGQRIRGNLEYANLATSYNTKASQRNKAGKMNDEILQLKSGSECVKGGGKRGDVCHPKGDQAGMVSQLMLWERYKSCLVHARWSIWSHPRRYP